MATSLSKLVDNLTEDIHGDLHYERNAFIINQILVI